MKKPFVVCHMLTSLDGKIDGEFFSAPQTAPASRAYGELRGFYGCQATLYGTTTMIGGYAAGPAPALWEVGLLGKASLPQEADFVSPEGKVLGNFIVALDPKGELGYHTATIEKKNRPAAHVIEAVTEQASSAYLQYLRGLGISYLTAGRERVDCALLLDKLSGLFGIERLMVAGGGLANWSFLQEGLIDELSWVVAPVADGSTTAVSIFERGSFLPPHAPVPFRLKEVKTLEGDTLWLRYLADNAGKE